MEVGTAVVSVRAAIEAAKSAKDVNDPAEINAAMSEVMEKLAIAQSDLVSVIAHQQELAEENRRLRDCRFERYRLCKTPMGHFIYKLKEEHVSEDEVAHAICVKCRENGRLSILQEESYAYICPTCDHTADIEDYIGYLEDLAPDSA
tara:strand:- start:14634 stop:15074 length:441 start_codon:yes stop_codon:yes gene_type:complete